jgi:tetrahydromethanopterin S-methyltransferase subunit G
LSPLFEEQRKEVNEAIEATRSEQEQRDKVQKDIRRQNWAILVGTVIIIILTAAGLAVALHW